MRVVPLLLMPIMPLAVGFSAHAITPHATCTSSTVCLSLAILHTPPTSKDSFAHTVTYWRWCPAHHVPPTPSPTPSRTTIRASATYLQTSPSLPPRGTAYSPRVTTC